MDLSKLTGADLAYLEGFVQKCAEKKVSPETLLTKLAKCSGNKSDGKKAEGGKKSFKVKKATAIPPHMVETMRQAVGGAGRSAGPKVGAGATALADKIKSMIAAAMQSKAAPVVGAGAGGVGLGALGNELLGKDAQDKSEDKAK